VTVVRGETVPFEVLGDGDGSRTHQAFTLKKKPLTYVPAPAAESGVASTLRVWVDGQLWTEVPTLYGHGGNEQVYVVRQNDDGESTITFGDGIRGSRLPSGSGNVVASYRFGAGAAAPPAGSLTQLAKPVPGIKSVVAPLPAGGGADAEPARSLATLAPRSALLLGRAISIDDMEAAALAAPGVVTARADWAWDGVRQRPVIKVWVVGSTGVVPIVKARLLAIAEPNTPIEVTEATRRTPVLAIDLEIDPRRVVADVIAAAKTYLLGEDGWLTPAQLGIASPIFRSALVERVLRVVGVTGVRGLSWTGIPFSGYGKSPGTGSYFDFTTTLVVTGS
jgi:predicted phage baseplate assembly protein